MIHKTWTLNASFLVLRAASQTIGPKIQPRQPELQARQLPRAFCAHTRVAFRAFPRNKEVFVYFKVSFVKTVFLNTTDSIQ